MGLILLAGSHSCSTARFSGGAIPQLAPHPCHKAGFPSPAQAKTLAAHSRLFPFPLLPTAMALS